jgi:hypothetical protein
MIWTDWAIFPTAFINGLEAMLNQTESEIQPFLSYLPSPLELEEDFFTLKRHAKFHGISSNIEIYVEKFGSNIPSSVDEKEGQKGSYTNEQDRQEKYILCRLLGCIKQYVKNKENPISLDVREEDELDGVPVDDPTRLEGGTEESAVTVTAPALVEITLIGKRDGWVEVSAEVEIDGEDVDGIPIDDLDGVPLVDEDDIDGVPIGEEYGDDDIDGVPLDGDEIDGAPL